MRITHTNGDDLGILDAEIIPRIGETIILNNTKFKVKDIEYNSFTPSLHVNSPTKIYRISKTTIIVE